MKHWRPPDCGKLKINYDVVVLDWTLFIEAICRNSKGAILHARASKLEGSNPIKGEAGAARMAAELFMGSHLTIEGDYLNLVNQVCDMNGFLDWEIEGEVNTIRQLLKANANWSIEWIPHEGNVAAYNLAHWCINHFVFGWNLCWRFTIWCKGLWSCGSFKSTYSMKYKMID